MALYVPLSRAARACLSAARARARAEGGACGRGAPVPPCPPCRPAPQPPCRARPPAVRRALRRVCCAPPAGQRPPCAPRVPACSLTCRDSVAQNRDLSNQVCGGDRPLNESSECECDQDPVARRLSLAKRARRAEYECEVARLSDRAAACAPPPAPYRLGGERECARATDGCTYAVLEAPAGPTRCGPGRTPPPPRCVELAPDDGCRIKGDAHLDPCAHRPRVMIEIDRSTNIVTKKAAPARSQSPCATRADVPGWCANPPPPAAAPQRCRRPTIVERLRARPPESQSERRIHTSVALSMAKKSVGSVSGGLEGMLRSKEQLKEAGLGRVVIDAKASRADQKKPPGGRLELSVPPGTERVAVLVSLERAACGPCSKTSSKGAAASTIASSTPACAQTISSCANVAATCERKDPWLSIKKIQKKLTGQCDEASVGHKTGPTPAGAGCGRPSPAPQRPAAPKPCAKPANKPSRCKPPPPTRCGGSPNKTKSETKRCSSTSTFLANTIVVNSLQHQP